MSCPLMTQTAPARWPGAAMRRERRQLLLLRLPVCLGNTKAWEYAKNTGVKRSIFASFGDLKITSVFTEAPSEPEFPCVQRRMETAGIRR